MRNKNPHKWGRLDNDMVEALEFILTKVARIVNGDPRHKDSWDDVAGYAILISKRLEEENHDDQGM